MTIFGCEKIHNHIYFIMNQNISLPALTRLCMLDRLLSDISESGIKKISSDEIGKMLGVASHNIRIDLIDNIC